MTALLLALFFVQMSHFSVEGFNDSSFTFVNASGECMFYAKSIFLTVINDTKKIDRTGGSETYNVPVENVVSQSAKMNCSEYGGKMSLKLAGGTGGPYNLKLDSLYISLTFKSSEALQWWSVDQVEVKALGSVVSPKGSLDATFNGSQLQQYIEGPKTFAYACGQQNPLIFSGPAETITVDGKEQQIVRVKYALHMANLQVQPFRDNRSIAHNWHGFTREVYDCVPFMSIGVWMFLFCTSILLCIVLSGIAMLASLKTNDRYDDIKGKTLVVNVKE